MLSYFAASRKHGIRFMFGIDCNRKVSPEKGQWFQLRLLPNFHQGQVVWLKDFGFVPYVEIQKNQFEGIFENVYRWQKKLFRPMIKNFIDDFILDKNHLLPQRVYK